MQLNNMINIKILPRTSATLLLSYIPNEVDHTTLRYNNYAMLLITDLKY